MYVWSVSRAGEAQPLCDVLWTPLSLPPQLLPPSLLFLQKTERQVLYSLLAMRWHHPVFHHVHRTRCTVCCHLLETACSALSVCHTDPFRLVFLTPSTTLISKVHETKICTHLEEQTQCHRWLIRPFQIRIYLPIRWTAHLITLHSDLLLPSKLLISHKQAWGS